MGRPPVMVGGVPVSRLPMYSVRLTPGTRARLAALASVTGTPAYRLVETAILEHLERVDDATRAEVERRVATA